MADATLHLNGRHEIVVRTALIKYLGQLDALKKTEQAATASAVDTDELIEITKDMLAQLGYVPEDKSRAKGSADVTRKDPAQIDFTDTSAENDTGTGELLGGPKASDGEPKVFQVECLDCQEKFQARGTSCECPKCGATFGILADEFGEIVRLTRGKAKKAPPE